VKMYKVFDGEWKVRRTCTIVSKISALVPPTNNIMIFPETHDWFGCKYHSS
jgi:hypothetical protein